MLTEATIGGETFVRGELNAQPNRTYRLEFFADSTPDPSGSGEGRRFLGARNLVVPSSSSTVSFSYVLPPVDEGDAVSATATHPTAGTSEIGTAFPATSFAENAFGF